MTPIRTISNSFGITYPRIVVLENDMVAGCDEVRSIRMRTEATMVQGIRPCCYLLLLQGSRATSPS